MSEYKYYYSFVVKKEAVSFKVVICGMEDVYYWTSEFDLPFAVIESLSDAELLEKIKTEAHQCKKENDLYHQRAKSATERVSTVTSDTFKPA